jgi:5,6-dimethylbenzimidazole synthase
MTAGSLGFDAFPEEARTWIHRLFQVRRDVRHFDPTRDVPPAALRRMLECAHQAPSVGLSQPWRFVMVRDLARRARIRESFLLCREREAARFTEARRAEYRALTLEGIVEAPLNLCVAADLRPSSEPILGTTAQPETLRASVVCAVQNLWLAARAEGLGVGWVSIVELDVLRRELALPPGVELVAYLCVGYPARRYDAPMLEELGWKRGRPLASVLHDEVWSETPYPSAESAAAPTKV